MSGLLKLALDPNQLQAKYQPLVDCRCAGTPIVMVECLIRGPRDTNLFNPQVLFEYARRKHVEHALDLLAFHCFLGELSRTCDIPFSVNFHASTLSRDRGIVAQILALLQESGVPARLLHIELIESAPEINVSMLVRNLNDLRQAEVQIVLDDFGVAYANLHLLDIVRPEIVKIDRSLLPVGTTDPTAPTCFLAAVKCAQTVGARSVAEGVETAEQLAYVRSLEVDYAQGFYFDRPMDISQLQNRLWQYMPAENLQDAIPTRRLS
jgi:EAL domain-containing protein (putative c-di-GMP-specific phosphodiesterase class I)